MKYYIQQSCPEVSVLQAGKFRVQFEQAAFLGGQWWGIFSTDNEEVIAAMTEHLVGKRGVMEATQADFEAFAKKKGTRQTHTWVVTESVSGERPSPPTPQTPLQAEERVADSVPVEDKPGEDHSIDDLLATKQRDEGSPKANFVTSQSGLAEVLGVSLPKLRDLLKTEGNPGKDDTQGYNIPLWEAFYAKHAK